MVSNLRSSTNIIYTMLHPQNQCNCSNVYNLRTYHNKSYKDRLIIDLILVSSINVRLVM